MYFTVKVFLLLSRLNTVPRAETSCGCYWMVHRMAEPFRPGRYDGVDRLCLRFYNILAYLMLAEMILAAVSLSTDFSYSPTNDHVVAVFIGVILFHGVLNTLNTAWLARITSVSLLLISLKAVLFIP